MKIRVRTKNLAIVYANHYDGVPISGACRVNGRLASFKTTAHKYESTWRTHCEVTTLDLLGRLALWMSWKWFCLSVGTHLNYKNGRREGYYRYRKPRWFHNLLISAYYGKWIRH